MRSAAEDIDGACGRAACRRHSSARARRGRRKERELRGIGSPNEHAPAESLPSLCCLFATSITSCDWHVSTRARFMAALAALRGCALWRLRGVHGASRPLSNVSGAGELGRNEGERLSRGLEHVRPSVEHRHEVEVYWRTHEA